MTYVYLFFYDSGDAKHDWNSFYVTQKAQIEAYASPCPCILHCTNTYFFYLCQHAIDFLVVCVVSECAKKRKIDGAGLTLVRN